jgi:hypothetical protein
MCTNGILGGGLRRAQAAMASVTIEQHDPATTPEHRHREHDAPGAVRDGSTVSSVTWALAS